MYRNPRPIAVLSDLADATVRQLVQMALASAPDPRARFRDNFPVWDWSTRGGTWVVPTTPSDKKAKRDWRAVLAAKTTVDVKGIRQTHPVDVYLIGLFDANASKNATYRLPYGGLQDHAHGVALVVPAYAGFADLNYSFLVSTLVHELAHVADDVPRKRYEKQEKRFWQQLIDHDRMTVEQVANTAEIAHQCYDVATRAHYVAPLAEAIRYGLDESYKWEQVRRNTTPEIQRRTLLAVVRYFEDRGWPPSGKEVYDPAKFQPGGTKSDVGPIAAPDMDWDTLCTSLLPRRTTASPTRNGASLWSRSSPPGASGTPTPTWPRPSSVPPGTWGSSGAASAINSTAWCPKASNPTRP